MAPRGNHFNNNQSRKRSGQNPTTRHHTNRNANNNANRRSGNNRFGRAPAQRHFGCGICQADHRLTNCKKFDRMNLAEKYQNVVKLHYCVNCLARNHLIGKCTSKVRCQTCGGKHHTVLHGPQRIIENLHTQRSVKTPPQEAVAPIPAPRRLLAAEKSSATLPSSRTKTLVPTAVVQVESRKRNRLARALLNPSLTTSRIAVSFVREADLAPFKVDDQVYVKVEITANVSTSTRYEVCMLVVNDLPKNPYPSAIDASIKNKFCRISLADPEFYLNSPVAMELGGELYTTLLQSNVIHVDGGSLVAQDSALGWLVMGSISH